MICHMCVLVFTEVLDFLKQIIILNWDLWLFMYYISILGRVALSGTWLTTDARLTAHPGVPSSIPAWSHTFVEIDHEIISTVILPPHAYSFKKECCQIQAKVCTRITG